ncbi:MAG: carbamoyltransferase C-terminal domain-containing protein [Candidatus Micrarchaeia archaeon]
MILGIHNCHDAGAAVVDSAKVIGAVNEERFTKKKNDVGFPKNSINWLLSLGCDIDEIAIPWIGGSALISRIFPKYEEKRREIWRRKAKKPSRLSMHLTNLAFKIIQDQKPKQFWEFLGKKVGGYFIKKYLEGFGLQNRKITFVEHHLAHAASAYFTSGFKEAIVITLDGAGDGLSGSVWIGDNGNLERIRSFKASASLGILYGAVTLALDLKYSEDEGKVMSLAAYSYPCEINEFKKIVRYDETKKELVSDFGIKYELLLSEWIKENLLWKYCREEVAYAVQKYIEEEVEKIIRDVFKEYNIPYIAAAGGLFSNVKMNMKINNLDFVKELYVFPHMGDGGLALGAALLVDYERNGKIMQRPEQIYFGPEFSNEEIEETLKKHSKEIKFEEVDVVEASLEKILNKEIVLWFQGKLEYGPRALGNRSIFALPNVAESRDKLNIAIKRRPYYQPFAATILEEDAKKILEDYKTPNRFMTIANMVKKEYWNDMIAASHIDHTTRPQILGKKENKMFRKLIQKLKKEIGIGAIVNTSFNKHGYPIVCTPEDAVWTLLNTGAKYLAIGNFFVEKI